MQDASRAGMKIRRKGDAMADMTTALRHLRWADDLLFEQLAALPSGSLEATYGPENWTVAHLAQHIVGSADWFCFCLTGMPWSDVLLPRNSADLNALRQRLRALDDVLLAEESKADEEVHFEDEDGPRSALRSIILAQACYHSTEHRTQIACALEVNAIRGITLDDYDLWAFAKGHTDGPA